MTCTCNIFKHERLQCLTKFPNTENRVYNTTRGGECLTNFKAFRNVLKYCIECLILSSRSKERKNKIVKIYAS